jgi:hypothetical protein
MISNAPDASIGGIQVLFGHQKIAKESRHPEKKVIYIYIEVGKEMNSNIKIKIKYKKEDS